MANTNTDLTEEDAADLQFPKAQFNPEKTPLIYDENICKNCLNDLLVPYIYCVKCNYNICAPCFAKGSEFLEHKSDHEYSVIRDDFPLFNNSDWTAKEEITLLDSLLHFKNWNLVAKELPNRSLKEIKQHYDQFYLNRLGSKHLPKMGPTEASIFPEIAVPYRIKILDTDEPPRYAPNAVGYKYLAGYNPARSDFESEFDANAEELLSNLKEIETNDPHYKLLTDLQCGIVNSYNRRLSERQRWKKTIRDHGLILFRKTFAWLHRYDLTITRTVYEKLIRFMQFCSPFKFEFLLEGLHRAGELKVQILKLCDLRQKGIKTLAEAKFYKRLKETHEKCESELKAFQQMSQLNWKSDNKELIMEFSPFKRRSGFTPIEIVGMPGYEKLSPLERDLCRNIRLVPITYLELKDLLVGENKKMGCLKLKTARKMLKIDVNKTRRLYDFLVQEGFINKPSS